MPLIDIVKPLKASTRVTERTNPRLLGGGVSCSPSAREGHRRGDIVGVARRDRIYARLGRPRIDPSSGLGESGRIAEDIRILEVLEQLLCSVAVGIAFEHRKWKVDRNQISADRIAQALPVSLRWP